MTGLENARIVKISDLTSSPVPVHIHSNKQTEHISANLEADIHGHVIRIAKLNSKMYVIDGHMLVEAHRRLGIKSVRVAVHNVKNIREVITMHVKHNMNNPPNPIQLVQVILYMRKAGDSDREIAKALKSNKFIGNLLRLKINADAVKELEGILVDLSKMYYSVHHFFPYNLIEWVFRQPMDKQVAAAAALRRSIDDLIGVSERKFIWPTPMEVRVIQRHAEAPANQKVVPVPLRFNNEGMRGRPKSTIVGASVVSKPPSESEMRKICADNTPASRQKLAFKCPHGSLLYMDGKSRIFHVDEGDDKTIVRLQRIDSENNVYRISEECSRFMRVKNGRIFLKMSGRDQALSIVKKLKKGSNICILSAAEL